MTLIGEDAIDTESGSGRGFNETAGWDKNFVGTGLRTLDGAELAALARPAVSVFHEDFRAVGGVQLPFRTRVVVPGATITYTAESIRHNQPIDQQLFERPRSH